MKFYTDGYPFIFISLLITIITSAILIWAYKAGNYNITFYSLLFASCFFFVLTIFMAFFFRDPDRKIPDGESIFVSPADGKVIRIREIYEKDYLKSDSKKISIFMSPLDVHVNRAPCDGKVSVVKHSPGKYMAAFKNESSIKNENIVMIIEGKEGRILVRQVAGFLARRAVCKVKVGDLLKRGERYGIIKFGSRVDVYLPKDTNVSVKLGEMVKAGETVIGGRQ
ncbi:MAG: phosphatidylserine decarboxylase [Nitrospirae bacterium RBG_13_39_12]|nr:MAG: phosphatidylserine decarboxylase [Nitrospirae bacterium RBG_13_39_12]